MSMPKEHLVIQIEGRYITYACGKITDIYVPEYRSIEDVPLEKRQYMCYTCLKTWRGGDSREAYLRHKTLQDILRIKQLLRRIHRATLTSNTFNKDEQDLFRRYHILRNLWDISIYEKNKPQAPLRIIAS